MSVADVSTGSYFVVVAIVYAIGVLCGFVFGLLVGRHR